MKILFVARHFPPAISGGAQRPFLFARELLARGHEVCVIAPEPLAGMPVVVVPHRHVGLELAAPDVRTPGIRDCLRTLMLPDPDIRWARQAGRAALPFVPDWIVTTSPPESSHVAGWLLKRRHGCRWLADFRDHWFESALHRPRQVHAVHVAIERRMAQFLLCRADALMSTTKSIGREAAALSAPRAATTVIPHASDPPVAAASLELGRVHIVHTGSFALSDPGRELGPVLRGFETLDDDRIRLHLAGNLRDDERLMVMRSSARDRIVLHGAVDNETARSLQSAADILLLVTAPDTPHVPGKLAEYRAAGKPVLILGGGSWLQEAGLEAFSDPAQGFRSLERLPVLEVMLSPGDMADRLERILSASA